MTPVPGMRRLGLRLPQPTIRLRFTLLYSGLFLACGLGLLAITYLLLAHKYGGNFFAVPVPAGSTGGVQNPSAGEAAQAQAQKVAQELEDLRSERKQVRTRIEKLLGQMDLLNVT